MPKTEDPRGLKLDWKRLAVSELASLLGDVRPAVRQRAMQTLAAKDAEAITPLQWVLTRSNIVDARRNAVWTLCRIGSLAAMPVLRAALSDTDESVRHAAVQAIAVTRDGGSVNALLGVLEHSNPSMQRVAAEALGRIKDASAVPALLKLAAESDNQILTHSCLFAAIEIGDPAAVRQVTASGARATRNRLVALDQMENGGLKPAEVISLLDDSKSELNQSLIWILNHHPEWSPQLAAYLKEKLVDDGDQVVDHLASFAGTPEVRALIVETVRNAAKEPDAANAALEALGRSHLSETPPVLAEAVAKLLVGADAELASKALHASQALPVPKEGAQAWAAGLLAYAADGTHSQDSRMAALTTVPTAALEISEPLFVLLAAAMDPASPMASRSSAARILGRAKLNTAQLIKLTPLLTSAGPLELSQLLGAFDKGGDGETGLKVVGALKEAKALASLRPERLKAVLEKWPENVRAAAAPLITALSGDAVQQAKHLDEVIASLPKGDIRRGQAVFGSPKAACSTCHAIGYLGGKVGPDLTSIGTIRTERDLLESVIYPSASFVRSYEPMIVSTKGGDEYSGILKKDAPDEILLVTGPNAEVRIARADVAQMRPGAVSIMPQGLDQQLNQQELADLVAFLKGTKWGAN